MTALATVPDVEESLGRSLSAAETPRAESLLILASSAVSTRTGFRFAPGSYTISRRPFEGKVKIPATVAAITSVTAINERNGEATVLALTTDYTRRGRLLYGLYSHSMVEVAFTVTAAIPVEVVALVAGIVANTISGPPVGASSEQAGPFLVSYVNSSGKVWLSDSDKLILSPWMQTKTAVSLL